jgi:carbamoylphosphate synthase large subunit
MKSVGEVMGIGRSFRKPAQSDSIIRNRNGLELTEKDIQL